MHAFRHRRRCTSVLQPARRRRHLVRIVQRGPAPRPRHISASSISSRRIQAAMKRKRSWSRPPATQCVEGPPALLGFALDVHAGEHVATVRTHRRQRQPHVDGEPGHTAQALPRHRLAALRRRRPADAHQADAARSTLLHGQTYYRVRARRRLQPAEPAGRLVRSQRHRPAAYHGPQACSKSTRSPLESHEIAQSGSFQDRLGGESLPIRPRPGRSGQCARAGIRTRRGPDAAELGADPRDIEERLSPPADPAGERRPRRRARFAPPRPGGRVDNSGTTGQVGGKLQDGDGNVTDVVVASQAGLALVRVSDVVDKLRRETDNATTRRTKKPAKRAG